MKYRFRLQANFSNLGKAQEVYQQLSSNIIGKDIFRIENLFIENANYLLADFRFNNESDMDSTLDWVLARTDNSAMRRVLVSRHFCTHDDDSVKSCMDQGYKEHKK